MEMLNKNKLGLIVGLFSALIHAIWVVLVGIIPHAMQTFVDWISMLHLVRPAHVLETFNLMHGILLIIFAFISGYIIGWLFATVWNAVNKR